MPCLSLWGLSQITCKQGRFFSTFPPPTHSKSTFARVFFFKLLQRHLCILASGRLTVTPMTHLHSPCLCHLFFFMHHHWWIVYGSVVLDFLAHDSVSSPSHQVFGAAGSPLNVCLHKLFHSFFQKTEFFSSKFCFVIQVTKHHTSYHRFFLCVSIKCPGKFYLPLVCLPGPSQFYKNTKENNKKSWNYHFH